MNNEYEGHYEGPTRISPYLYQHKLNLNSLGCSIMIHEKKFIDFSAVKVILHNGFP